MVDDAEIFFFLLVHFFEEPLIFGGKPFRPRPIGQCLEGRPRQPLRVLTLTVTA